MYLVGFSLNLVTRVLSHWTAVVRAQHPQTYCPRQLILTIILPSLLQRFRVISKLGKPTQPVLEFPTRTFGSTKWSFHVTWYTTYTWLEYSQPFCFYCRLFKPPGLQLTLLLCFLDFEIGSMPVVRMEHLLLTHLRVSIRLVCETQSS